jgi:hypothetical protein
MLLFVEIKQQQQQQQQPAVIGMMIQYITLTIIKINLITPTFVNHVSKERIAMKHPAIFSPHANNKHLK